MDRKQTKRLINLLSMISGVLYTYYEETGNEEEKKKLDDFIAKKLKEAKEES